MSLCDLDSALEMRLKEQPSTPLGNLESSGSEEENKTTRTQPRGFHKSRNEDMGADIRMVERRWGETDERNIFKENTTKRS